MKTYYLVEQFAEKLDTAVGFAEELEEMITYAKLNLNFAQAHCMEEEYEKFNQKLVQELRETCGDFN